MQEDAQDVGLGDLRELQCRELEVSGAEPADERTELQRHDVDVGADLGQLLREEARDGAAQSIGRREQCHVQATRMRLGERCSGRVAILRPGRGRRVRPVLRRQERRRCLGVSREERLRDALAIDRRRERTTHADVGERPAVGAGHQVGEVRAVTSVHRDAVRVLERR